MGYQIGDLLGRISPERNSWAFRYGNEEWPNYIYKSFSINDYGTSAKAKAAALAYQKELQPKLKKTSKPYLAAKKYNVPYEEWVKKSEREKLKYSQDISNKQRAEATAAKRGAERTFAYKGKTYAMPNQLPIASLPRYKNFIKYLNDYVINRKPGTSVVDAVMDIPAYKNEPIQKGRKIRPNWEKNQARIWRDLSEYFLKGKKGNFRNTAHIDFFEDINVKNLIPKKDHGEIATLKTDRVAQQLTKGTASAIEKAARGEITLGNPLVKPIAQFISKNPNIETRDELISGIRKLVDKNLTTKQISDGVERTHVNIISRAMAMGRGEKIPETRFTAIQGIDPAALRLGASTLYRLYPDRIHRSFQKTVEEYYKDKPRLLKKSLNKLKDFEKIKRKIVDEFNLRTSASLRDAPFQFDHPISLKALERSGDVAGAIRTNPIAGDVNQFKKYLDQKLNIYQKNIMAGKDVDINLGRVDRLKNINQTLLGKLAGDFTMDPTGKIKVLDYGAKDLLDPKYDITKSLKANLGLGQRIKETAAIKDPRLVEDVKEVFGKEGTSKFFKRIKSLTTLDQPKISNFINLALEDARKGGQICNPFRNKGGRIGFASGTSCVDEVAEALDKDPIKFSEDVNKTKGIDSKLKNAATGFLNFAKRGGKFGALAAAGAATAGLVKEFMNDDPTTYLSNEDQQKNMLIDMITRPVDEAPGERPEILDWQLPVLGGAAVAGTATVAPSTIEAATSTRFGKKPSGYTKTGLKTLGRGLATLGTPAGMLAYEPFHLGEQIAAGDSPVEIATNPWNYAGAAFADPVTKFATKGLSPTVAKIMRLGISPGVLKTVSRRFGLPGLALSMGISGYEMFDNYRSGRGLFDDG
jgi:hypothetical protein